MHASPSVTSSTVTNRSFAVDKNTGLPSNFNPGGYGLPPHHRGPASVASNSTIGSTNFAKVKAGQKKIVMNEAERERKREEEAETDERGLAEDDSDSD